MAVSLGARLAKRNGAMPIRRRRKERRQRVLVRPSMLLRQKDARQGKGTMRRVCVRPTIALRVTPAVLFLMPSKKDCCIIPRNYPVQTASHLPKTIITSTATKQNTGSK